VQSDRRFKIEPQIISKGGLYKIECILTNKIYIGICKVAVKTRWKAHIRASKLNKTTALASAIRKYGHNNFIVTQLVFADWGEYLKQLEVKAIKNFNSMAPYGYNLTFGGDGIPTPTKETIEKIKLGMKLNPPKLTEKGRKAISDAGLRAWADKEHRIKRSKAIKIGLNNPEVHKSRCAAIQATASSESGRIIKSNIAKNLWNNPEYREKVNRLAKIGMSTEKAKQNRSIASKLRWEKERSK
jgi:group I intron endonuclease